MKKSNFILIIGLSSLFIFGCVDPNRPVSKQDKSKEEVVEHKDHSNNEMVEPIAYNKNERWLVNNEMKPFLTKGATLVDDYIAFGKMDYKTLTTQLKDQNKQLISSCTMTGKSHDELHKWLGYHLNLVSNLEKTTDETEAKAIARELQYSYALYNQYFH